MDCNGPFTWYIREDGLFGVGELYGPGLYFWGTCLRTGPQFGKHIKIGEDYGELC